MMTTAVEKMRAPERIVSIDSLFSVDEWAAMPDKKPRYQLVDGRLVQKMTTRRKHTKSVGSFLVQCSNWGENSGWQFFPEGTGVKINERTGYVPDIVGFAPGAIIDPEENYSVAPFLVVEVLSPGSVRRDTIEKKRDYASIEVQIYVVIDPDKRTVEVFRLKDRRYGAAEILKDDAVWTPSELPGLKLEVAKLWM